MQLSPLQRFNQALIQMSVLLYQVDGKIKLSEQDYVDQLISELSWQSPISLTAFVTESIHAAREAVDNYEELDFLRGIVDDLNFDASKAQEVAFQLTAVDGERCEREVELMKYLTNKALARELQLSDSAPHPKSVEQTPMTALY